MSGEIQRYVSSPGARVSGEIRVPGDKSISHRAAMLGAMAEGVSEIRGFLEGEDCDATLAALAQMGVRIEQPAAGELRMHGVGLRGLAAPTSALELGNSGTSMRLLAGLIAGAGFDAMLVGDASLMRRPMERVAAPLRKMGADVRTRGGMPPVSIHAVPALRGIDHRLALPSAQVKSALLLAGLQASGRTSVREPASSRDHTERMLPAFGVAVARDGDAVAIEGPARLRATRVDVPGDFSSAAFFIAAGLIAGSAPLCIRNVGVNPTRTAFLDILRAMGADIRVHRLDDATEPRADIEVSRSSLRGIVVPESLVPSALDELPALFAVAAVAEGTTRVTGAAELRVKESDRLAAMAEGLEKLGIRARPLPDGLEIAGGRVAGGTVDSHGDHRVAMAFAVLGSCAFEPVVVRDVQNVATSFPGFIGAARAAGLLLAEEG